MLTLKYLPMLAASAALAGLAATGPVAANVIYDFTTGGNGNANQSGTAEFNFSDSNDFTLTLTNTGTITSIASLLDGINFTESGTLTGITLTQIAEQGVVDCSVNPCTTQPAGNAPTSDWAVAHSGGNVTFDAGGINTFHPDAVVNGTFVPNSGLDGLSNGQHNPNFLGPVVFSFTTTGEDSIPTISNVVFKFGTTPDSINGIPSTPPSVPEPASLALLGSALVGLGFAARRQRLQSR